MTRKIIQVGTILTFETGAYSDREFFGPFVVKRVIDAEAALSKFRAVAETIETDYDYSVWHFVSWLQKEGYVEECDLEARWSLGEILCAGRASPRLYLEGTGVEVRDADDD